MINIIQSDAVKFANEYDGPLFHSLLSDPPYHLTSIVKRFGKEGSAPAQFGKDGAFSRASKGFMGKVWDGGDVAFQPETWAAFMKVLHPGAFGMAFASARGWHRLAVAIEDAGFVIHPTIFGWLYGQGFPKATRIDTQIDRAAGVEQKKIPNPLAAKQTGQTGTVALLDRSDNSELSLPSTDLAKAWASHRYGLQALKPALEPIIVFQKPYEGKPIDCMVATGAGALNIDGGRIPADKPYTINTWDDGAHPFGDGAGNSFTGREVDGRWPANFILGDAGAANALDVQSGNRKSGHMGPEHKRGETAGEYQSPHGIYGKFNNEGIPLNETIGDEGGASRFFYRVQEQIDESDPVYYCSKASKKERDEGLENLPVQLFGQSGGAQSALARGESTYQEGENTSTGMNTIKKRHNPHPTLKPIALAKYLATLLLPPAMYAPRRLFVPFAGVASECIGASQALWEDVVGIEMEAQYCEIARARSEYWEKKGVQLEMFK